jgi:glycosyltransferase involved in cell wall biosynthesis
MRPPRQGPLVALHCRSSATRYGPERSLLELAPALHEEGVRTRLLALYRRAGNGHETHPWIQDARAAGIEAEQILDPGPLSLRVVRRLARRVGQSGADVLHTHDYRTNILGGLVARRADRSMPWVATVHLHTTTTTRLRIYRALDLFLLRLADRVVTVSRDQRRLLLRRGVDRRRIVLVPTILNAGRFVEAAAQHRAVRAGLHLPDDAPLVTTVGRLTAQKGVSDFLVAAQAVWRVRPETRFLVVGGGPQQEELEARAGALGLNGAVRFLGFRPDVAPILAASDVVVLPSRAEGLPLVLLEALAVGRPVVATRVGGIPDVVRSGETGLLVAPGAPAELAASVLHLLLQPDAAERLGEAGRRHVERYCAPERAARRIASVYRTVLAERH